jgi:hypothetical protein
MTERGIWTDLIKHVFAHCPAGCDKRGYAAIDPDHTWGIVYRSSRRSVTFRCNCCGLLWTMTWHQMAKAAHVLADRGQGEQKFAEHIARIAREVGDGRGRVMNVHDE